MENTEMIPMPVDPKMLPAILEHPELRKMILGHLRKNNVIASLGNPGCFFIDEAGTTKRAFKAFVELSFPAHFVYPGDANSRPMIIAEGYDKINQYAGIEIIDVNRGQSPYERDKAGRITGINLHRVGVGYGPTGNLVSVDQTYHADCSLLMIMEIQSKMKKFPFLGCIGRADAQPQDIVYHDIEYVQEPGKKWKSKKVSEESKSRKVNGVMLFFEAFDGGYGYWLDSSHPESFPIFEGAIQKQRFLERSSLSVIRRLILAAHPAIATRTPFVTEYKVGGEEDGWEKKGKVLAAKGYVVVYGFAMNNDPKARRAEFEAMANRVAQGAAQADVTLPHHEAGIEDAEIVDPVAGGADPSELPPQDEQEPDGEPYRVESTPQTSTPVPQSANPDPVPSVQTDPATLKQQFMKLVNDETMKVQAAAALKSIGAKTFGEVRISPEKTSAFIAAFEKGGVN